MAQHYAYFILEALGFLFLSLQFLLLELEEVCWLYFLGLGVEVWGVVPQIGSSTFVLTVSIICMMLNFYDIT